MLTIVKDKIVLEGLNVLDVKTKKAYRNDLKLWDDYMKKTLYSATIEDIKKYINYLETKKKYKNSTINRKLNSLSKFCSLYQIAGIVRHNIIVEYNILRRVRREYITSIDINFDYSEVKKVLKKENKYTIIILFLASTGCRISEALNIKNSDIKSSNNHKRILITGKRNKQRTIFIKNSLFNKIKKWYPTSYNNYLFYNLNHNKIDRTYLSKKISLIFRQETNIHVTPHQLRHFYATYQLVVQKQNIKKISVYLGHSSSSITADMYINSALEPTDACIF